MVNAVGRAKEVSTKVTGSSPVLTTRSVRLAARMQACHACGAGSIPARTAKYKWKVGEWLKPADCNSAPLRVRRFESVPSN